jgi:hypothetical protein
LIWIFIELKLPKIIIPIFSLKWAFLNLKEFLSNTVPY